MKRCRELVSEIEAIDVANCLMLLSKVGQTDNSSRVFACKTCNKRFSSFQALGGHRASHKKPRLTEGGVADVSVSPKKPKNHECSICGMEFAIGQALGGHMRRHRAAAVDALNEGLVTRDLLPEMNQSSGDEIDLCLDLKLMSWGTDLELKLGKVAPAAPIVHCFFI